MSESATSPNPPGPAVPQLYDREQLRELPGRRQTAGSFTNWLYRTTKLYGFPRPVIVGDRAVAWRADEVAVWLAGRPRGGQRNAVHRRTATPLDPTS